jgi:hypothetical protein
MSAKECSEGHVRRIGYLEGWWVHGFRGGDVRRVLKLEVFSRGEVGCLRHRGRNGYLDRRVEVVTRHELIKQGDCVGRRQDGLRQEASSSAKPRRLL